MKTLELKHLAPYLPYGLKILYSDMGEETTHTLTINHNTITSRSISMNCMLNAEFVGICTPILHPLSDLTKEIEVNGEKFVPLAKMVADLHFAEYDKLKVGEDISSRSNKKIYNVGYDKIWWKLDFAYLPSIRFDYAQKLFEWHFDVFGLIKDGLAIDIKTIK